MAAEDDSAELTAAIEGGTETKAPDCEERPFGLMSVAQHNPRGSYTWGRGLQFDRLPCGELGVVSVPCPPLEDQLKTAQRGFDTETADAFAVYAGWECSAGALDVSEAWDNAEELMERGWKHALEQAFWTGVDQDDNQINMSLTFGGAEDLTPGGGALDVTGGIAALESYMADNTRCLPTIHANFGVGVLIMERNLAVVDFTTGKARLKTGSKLALGGGYRDTGPDGASNQDPAAGEAWIYATGPVKVTSSPTFFRPERGDMAGAVDRSINEARVFAERLFSVQLGCGLAAVRVTLDGCCCCGS